MNPLEMNLRAFFISFFVVKKVGIFLLAFFAHNIIVAQNASTRDIRVPYEIKFANVTFQFNDATRFILAQEVASLKKSNDTKIENLKKFSMVLPTVESILTEGKIPSDFKYLSIYRKYQSSVYASTLLEEGVYWCFDKNKAIDVDLIVNNEIDERKHLIMASKGAVVSLKRSQVLYDNWGLSLYSQIASREVINMLEVSKKWKGEYLAIDSPGYSSLIQFLAFKLVIESDFSGFKNPDPQIVYEYKNGKGKSLNLIAADLKIDPIGLYESNAWLKIAKVPECDANVIAIIAASRYNEIRTLDEMSKTSGKQVLDLGFPLLNPDAKTNFGKGGQFYSINNLKGIITEMCDDFVNLAYKADISPKSFLQYNDMTEKDAVKIGHVYYIQSKNSKGAIPHHIVKDDETLWEISQMYGVKLEDLLKYNRMENVGRLQNGRVVWLQQKRPKNKPIEYVEFPAEISPDKQEKVRFQEPDIAQIKELRTEKELFPEPEIFKSEILKKNTFDEPVVSKNTEVIKEVKTAKVDTGKPFSEELRETIPERRTSDKEYLVHEVKKGETLYRISVNYRVSVEQLYRLNNLTGNLIEVGDRIIVKKY